MGQGGGLGFVFALTYQQLDLDFDLPSLMLLCISRLRDAQPEKYTKA